MGIVGLGFGRRWVNWEMVVLTVILVVTLVVVFMALRRVASIEGDEAKVGE